MKRITIVFLAVTVMAVSACAGGIREAEDSVNEMKTGDVTVSNQLSTEARSSGIQFYNWIIVSGSGSETSQGRNWNSR